VHCFRLATTNWAKSWTAIFAATTTTTCSTSNSFQFSSPWYHLPSSCSSIQCQWCCILLPSTNRTESTNAITKSLFFSTECCSSQSDSTVLSISFQRSSFSATEYASFIFEF
jgi:hypothetical protein